MAKGMEANNNGIRIENQNPPFLITALYFLWFQPKVWNAAEKPCNK